MSWLVCCCAIEFIANCLKLFVTVLKSDNANGLFSFEGTCQPFQAANEGDNFTCTVKRARGDAGTVTLKWTIEQINGSAKQPVDFNSPRGAIVFAPGQLRQVSTHALIILTIPCENSEFSLSSPRTFC